MKSKRHTSNSLTFDAIEQVYEKQKKKKTTDDRDEKHMKNCFIEMENMNKEQYEHQQYDTTPIQPKRIQISWFTSDKQ